MDAIAEVRGVRRRVVADGLGISFSAFAFAVVFGLAARDAGLGGLDTVAMSVIVLAGSAQFAALGLLVSGVPWEGILLVTALLNARHLLYSASLAPWFAGTPRRVRAAAGYVLADETYALAMPAIRSLGRLDLGTYWVAAAMPVLPWIAGTAVGYAGGQLLPDPRVLALDVVFPAAMAGLAIALLSDRRSVVALGAGAAIGLATALVAGPPVGIMAGGLLGPVVAMVVVPRGPSALDGAPGAAGTADSPGGSGSPGSAGMAPA
ncbi:MAG: AzlC family ABC transporter permease [Chloroflexota bacterium]